VAGVFDRQWCWLFVDGKQQGGRVKTGFSRTHRYSYVGADPNHYRKTVNLFQGLIEQVRISKVARNQGNFAPEKVLLADTDTVLLYRFDQGSGRQAIDLSGNDHHGLIKGAAWARPDDYPPPNAEADRPEMSQRPAGSEPLASTNPTEPPPLAIAPFDADRANQHQQAWAEYLDVPSPMTNSIGMELLLIPPGEFMMGSPEDDPKKADGETPQHRVRITKPFYLGVDEVTQEQYEKVMGENPSSFKEPSRPVESISWDDAAAFCAKLSAMDSRLQYRLPTEAEWEYACRAGTATRYSCGDDMDPRYAWFGDNSGRETHPVGRTLPNAWGLCDMHGNVWEYCHDWYDEDYYASSPLDDPAGPATGSDRVHRGGCWDFSTRQCWSACRRGHGPNFRGGGMGFRVARDLPIEAIAAPRAETDGLAGNTATASMQPQSPALAGTLSKPAAEGARIQAATEAQSPGDRLQEIILPTGTSWNPDAFEIDRSKLDILLDDYESDRPWVFGSVEQHRWFKYAVYRYRENDEGNFELDGLAAAFQENDEVVYYAEYRQNDLNGLMMTWSPEGKPVYCGQYRGNRRQGLCCLFENDSPRLISEYDNDNLVACVWIDGSERKGYKKEQLAEAEPVRELLARMDDIQADAIREYKKTLISQLVDDRRQKELEKTRAIGASVRKRNHAEIVQRTNARHVESLLRMQQKQREAH
jgi:formylglycine-generating enzyme required for sulfatase activity